MSPRPRWILDLHPDFPGSALVLDHLEERARRDGSPAPLIVTREDVVLGRGPFAQSPAATAATATTTELFLGYGTMHTMTRLARRPMPMGAAVFDDYAKLKCSSYYPHVYDLLGRTCFLVPFSALPTLPLQRMLASDRVFVRSDTNYKLFPAAELALANVAGWVETYREHGEELAVVSEVVRFDREYRCFLRDGAFFCGSSYAKQPLPMTAYEPVPAAVRRFAVLAATRMLRLGVNMCTVDVGVTSASGLENDVLRVVEIGGVNSWGIYGSNVEVFVREMEAEALERFGS